jgi:hypothetical protein
MAGRWIVVVWLALGACAAAAQESLPPQRVMNVTQGPETVFAEPIGTILPALSGARPTGDNGRVGLELVFWGYEQADGRRVYFFACVPDENVDCNARVPSICANGTTLLEQGQADGAVVRRQCRNVAVAGPGDRRPGCADRVESTPIDVGIVSCG